MLRIPHTDKELLELIAHRNERALTLLYNRYYQPLCNTAYKKLSDELVVEEIVQDVFIVVWEKAPGLDLNGDVKNYLFATLRNKVLYEFRARMAKAALAALFEPMSEISTVDASSLLQAKELAQRLQAAIEKLSPQSREAFRMSRFEQMSYKMIAEQLNVSVGTVEKHIGKALSTLRKEFSERDTYILIALAIDLLKSR